MAHVLQKKLKLNQQQIAKHFPNLKYKENFEYTSDDTDDYNCVAWATEENDKWIQYPPYNSNGDYEDSVNSYLEHFRILGFEITNSAELENGFDKIVIYIDVVNNEFKHVARLKPDGLWASKIGNWEDIEHTTPHALGDGTYGIPKYYLKRIAKPD